MSRGDVYMVSLNPAHGHEQRGRRPVLVISPTAFNQAAKLPVILPITSGGEFACRVGFAVPQHASRPKALCVVTNRGPRFTRSWRQKSGVRPPEIVYEVLARAARCSYSARAHESRSRPSGEGQNRVAHAMSVLLELSAVGR